MSKHAITKLFVGSLAGMVAGLALVAVGGGVAYANDLLLMRGPDVMGAVHAVGVGAAQHRAAGRGGAVAAAIGLLASWVAALVRTARLEDKTWFLVLLITGLVSLGLLGMVIYVAAGPDDASAGRPPARMMAGAGR